MTDVLLTRHEGPSPAVQIARDIVRRGIYVAPVMVVLGAVGWGAAGAASVAYGLAIVCANFLLAAFLIGAGARISAAMMGAAAMFGFLIRLGLIFLAVMLVKDAGWVELVPLGLTLIVTHLGLLFWEMKFVSASLAYPGLKPGRRRS
jgi:hypothetical protein